METRNLIFLQLCDDLDNALVEILSQDWVVHRARDLESLQTLIDQHCCQVGIVRFCEHGKLLDNPELGNILFTAAPIKWVAVLPSPVLEDEKVRQLVSRYFYDYHRTPVNAARLNMVLGHAWGNAQLDRQMIQDRSRQQQLGVKQGLVGTSAAIMNLRDLVKKIARVDTPVLITGESGTGKELAANLIHQSSPRAAGPFVAVNCAALPANLIQAELFGYEKGAFTGAYKKKIGRIEAANKGTIFLDEIGDLPPDMQITLLRFLQEQTIERVGGIEPIPVDVRVIAATNVNLQNAIAENRFREDLYYRLKVLRLHMPSLCQRGQDLEMLANYFINKFRDINSAQIQGLSQSAIKAMYSYNWPGNVRELMNSIRGALVMCEGPLILPDDLGLERRTRHRSLSTLEDARGIAEKGAILNAFEQAGNNITHAAEYLSISRGTLYRLMEKHAIDWPAKVLNTVHGDTGEDDKDVQPDRSVN
jgi:DNA-binding NtrC family response regulator